MARRTCERRGPGVELQADRSISSDEVGRERRSAELADERAKSLAASQVLSSAEGGVSLNVGLIEY